MIQSDALFDNKKAIFLQKSVHFFLANEHTIYPIFIEKIYPIFIENDTQRDPSEGPFWKYV